jgi:predicted ATPase
VWISGDSGVGKSALIQNFLHDKTYVCSGKFEFIKSSVPYAVVIKVLHQLCSFLEVEHLKLRISPEVISILTKLLPQIRHVTTRLEMDNGLDRIAEGNSGEWGFQKLKLAARAFIEAAIDAISSASKLPVIFHFDDLQWADEASLEIIKALWNGSDVIQDLICLSSFRGNEISDDSPFYRFREFFENSQYICTEISIGNLAFDDVVNVVAKLLNITRVQSEHLGRLVFDVTRGNALFIRRFLHVVLERKHIRQSNYHDDLEIDEANILVEFEGCEDIVNFLMQEMNSLPFPTSAVLKVAS